MCSRILKSCSSARNWVISRSSRDKIKNFIYNMSLKEQIQGALKSMQHQLCPNMDSVPKVAAETVKSNEEKTASFEARRLELLQIIEGIVLQIVTAIAKEEPVELEYHEPSWENVEFSDRVRMKPRGEVASRKVRLSHPASRPKLLLMVQLLEKAFQLLSSGGTATRRELFYQLMLPSKNALASAVRGVCSLLGAAPWELGILASSKGLVAGPLRLSLPGDTVSCSVQGGVLIPTDLARLVKLESDAKFVLVVEKDAIFQKLLDEGFLDRMGPCILVTGKGYPDVCTRQLLSALWDSLHVPMLALVDADPHGVEIMCVYRFGSLSMSEQSLAVPSLRWLGIHPTDIVRLGFTPQSLAPLTERDLSRARDLLQRPYIVNNPSLKHQVEELLRLGMKAEIEAVGNFSNTYLTDVFLPSKIANKEVL